MPTTPPIFPATGSIAYPLSLFMGLELYPEMFSVSVIDTTGATIPAPLGTGTFQPLSNFFSTLTAAQVVFPFVTALTQGLDWASLQAAVNAVMASPTSGKANSPGGTVHLSHKGNYMFGDETLTIGSGVAIDGGSRIGGAHITSSSVSHDVIYIQGPASGCALQNLQISGGRRGIYNTPSDSFTNSYVVGIVVDHTQLHGIWLHNAEDSFFSNVKPIYCWQDISSVTGYVGGFQVTGCSDSRFDTFNGHCGTYARTDAGAGSGWICAIFEEGGSENVWSHIQASLSQTGFYTTGLRTKTFALRPDLNAGNGLLIGGAQQQHFSFEGYNDSQSPDGYVHFGGTADPASTITLTLGSTTYSYPCTNSVSGLSVLAADALSTVSYKMGVYLRNQYPVFQNYSPSNLYAAYQIGGELAALKIKIQGTFPSTVPAFSVSATGSIMTVSCTSLADGGRYAAVVNQGVNNSVYGLTVTDGGGLTYPTMAHAVQEMTGVDAGSYRFAVSGVYGPHFLPVPMTAGFSDYEEVAVSASWIGYGNTARQLPPITFQTGNQPRRSIQNTNADPNQQIWDEQTEGGSGFSLLVKQAVSDDGLRTAPYEAVQLLLGTDAVSGLPAPFIESVAHPNGQHLFGGDYTTNDNVHVVQVQGLTRLRDGFVTGNGSDYGGILFEAVYGVRSRWHCAKWNPSRHDGRRLSAATTRRNSLAGWLYQVVGICQQ